MSYQELIRIKQEIDTKGKFNDQEYQRCLNNAKSQNEINRCEQVYKRDQTNMMSKIDHTKFF